MTRQELEPASTVRLLKTEAMWETGYRAKCDCARSLLLDGKVRT